MGRKPAPSAADLKLLDPDGSFIERLAEDHRAIRGLIETGAVHQAAIIVHRLAGAAGTFGFAEVGEVAVELDDLVFSGAPLPVEGAARLCAALERAVVAAAKKSG